METPGLGAISNGCEHDRVAIDEKSVRQNVTAIRMDGTTVTGCDVVLACCLECGVKGLVGMARNGPQTPEPDFSHDDMGENVYTRRGQP